MACERIRGTVPGQREGFRDRTPRWGFSVLATTPAPIELHQGTLRGRRAPGVVALGATMLVLVGRLLLPTAGPQPLALAVLSFAGMLVAVTLGTDRTAVMAALAGVAVVVLLPAGELSGLAVGSAALLAAGFAAAASPRRLSLVGGLALALLGELLTDTAGWLPLLGSGSDWRLWAAVLVPVVVLGISAWGCARIDPRLDPRWLLLLTFALAGALDPQEVAAVPLLLGAPLALAADQPRRLRALGWLVLGSGAVLAPHFGLLALAFALAQVRQIAGIAVALLAAGLGIVQSGAPDSSAVVLVTLLCSCALAQRLLTALPADLAILVAGVWHGPLGVLAGAIRIAPSLEPWMFGIATLTLVSQSFPWSQPSLDLAVLLGWRWPLAAGVAVALAAAALASRGKPSHRWVITAIPWLVAAATHVGVPLVGVPRDLTAADSVLEAELGRPSRGTALVVDSQLAFAAGLEAGTTVAEVEVRGEADQVISVFALRAGFDTAEWAAAAPGVDAPPGPHWIGWIAPSQTSLGSRSRARLALPEEAPVAAIRITRATTLPPQVLLTVHGVALE